MTIQQFENWKEWAKPGTQIFQIEKSRSLNSSGRLLLDASNIWQNFFISTELTADDCRKIEDNIRYHGLASTYVYFFLEKLVSTPFPDTRVRFNPSRIFLSKDEALKDFYESNVKEHLCFAKLHINANSDLAHKFWKTIEANTKQTLFHGFWYMNPRKIGVLLNTESPNLADGTLLTEISLIKERAYVGNIGIYWDERPNDILTPISEISESFVKNLVSRFCRETFIRTLQSYNFLKNQL